MIVTKIRKYRVVIIFVLFMLFAWGGQSLSNMLLSGYLNNFTKNSTIFLAAILVVPISLKTIDKQSLSSIGLKYSSKSLFDFGFGIVIGVLTLITFFINKTRGANFLFLVISFLGCIFIAIGEELVFRGYILQMIEKDSDFVTGLIFSSMAFGFLHLIKEPTEIAFINATLGGIIFAFAFYQTRQIWLSIGLHFSWNFFGPPVGLPSVGVLIAITIIIFFYPRIVKWIPSRWKLNGT